jgi:hypothetical protein
MKSNHKSIIDFIFHSYKTTDEVLKQLPNWLLNLVDETEEGKVTPETLTTVGLLYIRHQDPRASYEEALKLLQDSDAQKLLDIARYFTIACSFERLKRAGVYKDVHILDVFDPDTPVSVELWEKDLEFINSGASPEDVRKYFDEKFCRLTKLGYA